MEVHVGVITYGDGTVVYATTTAARLTVLLAGYCRDHWAERFADMIDAPDTVPTDDDECVADYFEDHPTEFLEFREAVEVHT